MQGVEDTPSLAPFPMLSPPTQQPTALLPVQLDTLIKATIAGGGVIPHIHKSLITNKQGKKEGILPMV